LAGNTYPNFQALVNRTIVLDNMCKEMDRKRRMQGQASGSNTRQHPNSQQRFYGPVSQWNHEPYPQRPQNQVQQGN
jgi:hypothetical protein